MRKLLSDEKKIFREYQWVDYNPIKALSGESVDDIVVGVLRRRVNWLN